MASGEIDVEFADGARARAARGAVDRDAPKPHPPYRANCMWYDSSAARGPVRVSARTARHACLSPHDGARVVSGFRDAAQILAVFEAHTNLAYAYGLTRARIARVELGDVLTLRDEVFHALHRNGVVVARTSTG